MIPRPPELPNKTSTYSSVALVLRELPSSAPPLFANILSMTVMPVPSVSKVHRFTLAGTDWAVPASHSFTYLPEHSLGTWNTPNTALSPGDINCQIRYTSCPEGGIKVNN